MAGKLNGVMPSDDAQRLAHGIDVDAGARAHGVFTLQRLRDAAGVFDDVEAALHVALGVGDDLAMFRGEQFGQFVHARLDQALELEHDAGAALRVHRLPVLEGDQRRLHRRTDLGLGGQGHAGLDLAGVGVEHVPEPSGFALDQLAVDEVTDIAHAASPVSEFGKSGRGLDPGAAKG